MGAYSDDLLFIHIPKCAGTSVRYWLREHVPGTVDFETPENGLPTGHVPLKDIERFTGRAPSSFKKIIAIVRNPYTQQLSQWLFWRDRRDRGNFHIHDVVAGLHPSLTSFLHDARCDFHLWWEAMHGSSEGRDAAGWNLKRTAAHVNRYPHYGGYYKYWVQVDGEIPDNVVILRMEELADVWLPEVGEFAVDGAPALPVVNYGPRSIVTVDDALGYYTPQAIEIVGDKFEWTWEVGLYERLVPTGGRAPLGPVL